MLYIGDVRRALFRPGVHHWNAWVRDVTARLEGGWLVRPEVFRVRRGLRAWHFHLARDVAVFLWGKDVARYKVWCRSKRMKFPTGNILEIEQMLMEAENERLS